MQRLSTTSRTLLASLALASATAVASADISGFGNFSGFRINQSPFDNASGPSFPGDGSIRLTGPTVNQSRNIFCETPQDVSQFTASFRYRATPRSMNGSTIGVALVLQSVAGGIDGVYGSPGGSLGYGGNSFFSHSVAVPLQYSEGAGSFTGRYTNGNIGGGLDIMTPVNIHSGNWISATVVYNGSTLAVSVRDTVTGQTYNNSYFVGSIPTRLNGSLGYIGITASTGTGFGNGTDQFISDFTYSVPSASTLAGVGLGGFAAVRRRRL